MSIIYDALKKVENEKNKNHGEETTLKQDAPVSVNKEHKKTGKFGIYVFLFILIMLFSFAGTLYVTNIKQNGKSGRSLSKNTSTKKNIAVQLANAVFSRVDAPKAVSVSADAKAAASGYNLEGIVYDAEQPFAIINGKMLKKTDMIDDFQITEITATTVELLNLKDNTKRTLSL